MPATTPARITQALTSAVAAARAQSEGFTSAAAELDRLDQARLGLVQAGIIRQLLEVTHPDGLDGEDVQDALTEAVRQSSWYPDLRPEAIGEALLGALGVLAPEDATTTGPLGAQAVLLIVSLLADQPAELFPALLRTELAEIERAETMEQP